MTGKRANGASTGRGWQVDSPPPPVKRAGRPADPGAAEAVHAAVASGKWVSNMFSDRRAAVLAARRIRYLAGRLHMGVKVRTRYTDEGTGIKLSVQITRERMTD